MKKIKSDVSAVLFRKFGNHWEPVNQTKLLGCRISPMEWINKAFEETHKGKDVFLRFIGNTRSSARCIQNLSIVKGADRLDYVVMDPVAGSDVTDSEANNLRSPFEKANPFEEPLFM